MYLLISSTVHHHGSLQTDWTSVQKKLRVNDLLPQFQRLQKDFSSRSQDFIETKENISKRNFSDVYRSVNYIGSLAKFT